MTLSDVWKMTEFKPFLLCRFPGESELRRYCFNSVDCARNCLVFDEATIFPWPGVAVDKTMVSPVTSTEYDDYCSRLGFLIAKLKQTGGKTVITRQICGKFSRFNPEEMALRYFAAFPDVFCFLFYHPFTGWWMGASPELLLQSHSANELHTRALAGTRSASKNGDWDDKNIEEHAFVTDDILNRIKNATHDSVSVSMSRRNLSYGKIEHLCTDITIASPDSIDETAIIRAIHPTPAVGGYPREEAMENIELFEPSSRNCYGGRITIKTAEGITSYVILRCVHFDTERWAIYTGSGITSSSIPKDEWIETEEKASPLISLLSKYSQNE